MKKRGEYYITQFFYLNLQTLIFIGKMKQLKFLMVALTLLMGISFTSCLNSDNDYAPTELRALDDAKICQLGHSLMDG